MESKFPVAGDVPALRRLWRRAFGDTDDFLDIFFGTAFSPRRCRCVSVEGEPVGALYWFDISCEGQKMAYLYAVATQPEFRGRGICRKLMADTHELLQAEGYAGAVLVPQGESLFRMYEKMGYRVCSGIREFSRDAGETPVSVRPVDREEYTRLRRLLLPEGGAVQEGENLTFLEKQAGFFAGTDFLLTARREEDRLVGIELLGNADAAPGILKALGISKGTFRVPGTEPFAMFLPLAAGAQAPAYFGLAFD